MKYVVVCIRDRAVDAFMQPWFVASVGAAVRAFSDEVNKADSPMNKHPDDYDLYEVAQFDDATGEFKKVDEKPRQVAIGKDQVKV